MKRWIRTRLAPLLLAAPLLSASSCGLPDAIQSAMMVLDAAIARLTNGAASWRQVLPDAIEQLSDESQLLIRNDLQTLTYRAFGAAGVETKCGTDFLGVRLKQALIHLRKELEENKEERDKIKELALEPVVCNVAPSLVRLDADHVPVHEDHLTIFGYDFDAGSVTVLVRGKDGDRNITEFLDKPSHYLLTLNLGKAGVRFRSTDERIVLRWDNRDVHTIGITKGDVELCKSRQHGPVILPPFTGYMNQTGGQDGSFAGNDTQVQAWAQLVPDGNKIYANVFVEALENGWNHTRGNGRFYVAEEFQLPQGYLHGGGPTEIANLRMTVRADGRTEVPAIPGDPTGPVEFWHLQLGSLEERTARLRITWRQRLLNLVEDGRAGLCRMMAPAATGIARCGAQTVQHEVDKRVALFALPEGTEGEEKLIPNGECKPSGLCQSIVWEEMRYVCEASVWRKKSGKVRAANGCSDINTGNQGGVVISCRSK